MKKALVIALFGCLSFQSVKAQFGGKHTYHFLKLPNSARAAALGGNQIAIKDNDINLVADNPALLSKEMSGQATLNYINYISDINMGYLGYAKHFEDIGTFSLGLQSIGYGDFTRTDEAGAEIGSFKAGEYALDVSYGNKLNDAISYGATVKFIYSGLANWNSFGTAVDLGVHYKSKRELFTAGLVINNLGYQLKPYVTGDRYNLPTEVQLGVAYRLPKAPIRFNVLLHNMQQWDITVDGAREDLPTLSPTGRYQGASADDSFFTLDKFLHHVNIGAEIIPSENFHLRLGYNYYRKQVLGNTVRSGLSGISFGLGFKIKRFHLNYGLASYHIGAPSHHLGISTNIQSFKR